MSTENYEILDDSGLVINTIVAEQAFVEEHYPGKWRVMPPIPAPEFVELPPPKTEEQKIANATAAAIAKLIADGVLKQT